MREQSNGKQNATERQRIERVSLAMKRQQEIKTKMKKKL
jgi:hypothetical protein